MSNKFARFGIAVVMVIGIGGLVYAQKQSATPAVDDPASSSMLGEVASHASREDCWTVINGNVYDLTGWIPRHPGGEAAILQLCGTDGSEKFNGMHGGDAQKEAVLAGFKVGEAGAGVPAPSAAGTDDDGTGDSGKNRRGGNDSSDD